jgi:hypothetical protein
MKHLDFVDKLSNLGISIRSTNIENQEKEFEINGVFHSKHIIAKNFKLKWKELEFYEEPIKALLSKAVDMDTWKHSWHLEMTPENYKKIEDIIQNKIIDRSKEIEELLSIYFQLRYEMSDQIKEDIIKDKI